MRVLHAIHDFLPKHAAGSEIYALELCRSLGARHHVTLVCAEYDPSRRHGHLTWRVQDGIPVAELVNNWVSRSFSDTDRSPEMGRQLGHLLRMVRPDIIHLHSLLNLSFDLPAMAEAHGIPIVATLHDYTLVCASGGQRVHRAEQHVCAEIDTARCARCFKESAFQSQAAFGSVAVVPGSGPFLYRAASALKKLAPVTTERIAGVARRAAPLSVTAADMDERLAAAREVFDRVTLFVAPSQSIATEFQRLGVDAHKVRVSAYGHVARDRRPRATRQSPLRIGFVGTIVWHKGVHVLLDAVRHLPAGSYVLSIFGDPAVAPDYSAELRRQSASLPVRFRGSFDRASAAEAYSEIDLLVVPSLWPENAPLVIQEAFMHGVPVVGARTGGIPEFVTHDQNGLIYEPPESAVALAAALRSIVDQPSRLDAFVSRLPPVKTMAENAEEWERIYADVVAAHARIGAPA